MIPGLVERLARRGARAVRGVHGGGAVRPGRGLLRHRRSGRSPGRPLPDLAGGRPAVRGRAGPGPRRLVGGAGAARLRSRSSTPGPGRAPWPGPCWPPSRPCCGPARSAMSCRSAHPPSVPRHVDIPAESTSNRWPKGRSIGCGGGQRAARQPALPPGRVRRRLAGGLRRRRPRRPARRGPAPVRRAPGLPSCPSPRTAPEPRSRTRRRGWVAGGGGRACSRGRVVVHRLRPHHGRDGRPPVAGVAADLPPPRARRPLPGRARHAGHHRRRRSRPAARDRHAVTTQAEFLRAPRPGRARRGGPAALARRRRRARTWPRSPARSRIREAEALTDPAGLGGFTVAEWVVRRAAPRPAAGSGPRAQLDRASAQWTVDTRFPQVRAAHLGVPPMADEPTQAIDDLLLENRTFPPPEGFKEASLVAGTFLYDEAATDYQGFWARQAAALLDWDEEWDTICEWDLPFAQWFIGGQAQRGPQLPRPPRRGGPGRQGGLLLGGRARRQPRHHLRRAAGRGPALRQRAEGPRRGAGRPGQHLPADDPRGRRGHAGLRPHRRRPQRGLRRLLLVGPGRPDQRRRGQGPRDRRRRLPPGRGVPAQAPGRRRSRDDARPSRAWSSCAAAATRSTCRTAGTTGTTTSWPTAERRVPGRADGRRAAAVPALHLGHHRQAQGDHAHQRRLPHPGGLHPQVRVRPPRGHRRLLVHGRRRLGDRATATSSTGRWPTAPPA